MAPTGNVLNFAHPSSKDFGCKGQVLQGYFLKMFSTIQQVWMKHKWEFFHQMYSSFNYATASAKINNNRLSWSHALKQFEVLVEIIEQNTYYTIVLEWF